VAQFLKLFSFGMVFHSMIFSIHENQAVEFFFDTIAGRFWSVRRLVEACKTFQRSENLVITYYGLILDREKLLSHWNIGNGAH
jgi:hypothetical protein